MYSFKADMQMFGTVQLDGSVDVWPGAELDSVARFLNMPHDRLVQ